MGQATYLLGEGRVAEAVPIFASTMVRFEALGDALYHALSMGSFVWIEIMRGNFDEARRWTIRTIVKLHALRDVASTTVSIQEAVVLALESGRAEDAGLLMGAFQGLCERHGVRPPMPLQQIVNSRRPRERLEEALSPQELDKLIDRGKRMSLDDAVAFIVRMADELDRAATESAGPAERGQ